MSRQDSTLGKSVYKELLSRIQTNVYQEGSRLPSEAVFCREFKVSRPVIRSAMEMLRSDGYISTTRGSGSFVTSTEDPELSKFKPLESVREAILCMEHRAALEGTIAYQAALRRTEHDKVMLLNAFHRSCQHRVETCIQYESQLDYNFHLAVAQASHNRFYVQTMKTLSAQILGGIDNMINVYEEHGPSKMYETRDFCHNEILQAILYGDPLLAKSAMEYHLFHSRFGLINQDNKNKQETVADFLPRMSVI